MPMKIQEIIKEKWQINVTRTQCQKARNMALNLIEEMYEHQFSRLRDYRTELLESNPNLTVVLETYRNADGLDIFNSFYVCFDVIKRTWKENCRRLLGFDGCFLKGNIKGQVMVALGRDADNAIYPAWAVVQKEDTINWMWFLDQVKQDLELEDGDGYVLISDRQKGLINAVVEVLPKIEHRNFVRHIYNNLKTRHAGKPLFKPLLWNLAWSYSETAYKENLLKLMKYDIAVYNDVIASEPVSWCRAFHAIGSCCEDVNNNSTESFNATILKAREKPLVPMLELIARQAMV